MRDFGINFFQLKRKSELLLLIYNKKQLNFMSQIREEFYEAINKTNVQKPKEVIKKFRPESKPSVEEQIQNILNESELAILDCEVIVNNQPLIDWLYEVTKKDNKTLELEKRVNQELEIINRLRDEARQKYNRLNRINEFTSFNPSAAASSAAAGSGGGSIRINVTSNSYVVDGYVDNYIV